MKTFKILSNCGFVLPPFLKICVIASQMAAFAVDRKAEGLTSDGGLIPVT